MKPKKASVDKHHDFPFVSLSSHMQPLISCCDFKVFGILQLELWC